MVTGGDETHRKLIRQVEDVEVGGNGIDGWSGGDALAIDRTIEQGINRRKKGKQVKGGESRHCGGGVREGEKGQN